MTFSKFFLSLAFVGVGVTAVGQVIETSVEEEKTVEVVKISYPYQVEVIDERDNVPYTITVQDPALIEKRLKELEKIMPMVYNESVERYLHFFTQRRPNFTKQMMENLGIYFPIFEKKLAEYNMPDELKYLSILESALNPKAVSKSKAVGLWQFMSFTGKEYGLTINDYLDERMHIEKSTDAACRYLKYLHRLFNDWDLALASYNSGQGTIGRAIKRTGLTSYWDLHPHIPKETRGYVPQFIALIYLMHYGPDHGIVPGQINKRDDLENIYVDSEIDLNVLASLSNISIEEIQKHNPHFKKTLLPANRFGHEIALPKKDMAYFTENRIAILDSVSKGLRGQAPGSAIASTQTLEDGTIVIGRPNTENSDNYVNVPRKVKKVHLVRKGEHLSKIAERYKVTTGEIRRWNDKSSSKVIVGERLAIFVDVNDKVKSTSVVAKKSSESITKPQYYTVRPGDTLWNISQRYDGVSVNDIKKWNNIKGNTVKVGQKIKVGA